MAEMARVLRPGSGRAVLLVAQPHLLGIPGLQRDNRKDRKKLREQLQVGHHSGGAEAKAAPEEDERTEQGRRGKANPLQAASSGSSDGREDERRNTVAEIEVWLVRARHVVNVGGLISYLLVLDRTNEPSPLPRSDRRKHVVGMTALCKRRNENQDRWSAGSS